MSWWSMSFVDPSPVDPPAICLPAPRGQGPRGSIASRHGPRLSTLNLSQVWPTLSYVFPDQTLPGLVYLVRLNQVYDGHSTPTCITSRYGV